MYMIYITTTELRTKSSELVKNLQNGAKISLIHRSKVIGVIQPVEEELKLVDGATFQKAVKALQKLKPKKLIPVEKRDEVYRKHLEEKYGKNLSGR